MHEFWASGRTEKVIKYWRSDGRCAHDYAPVRGVPEIRYLSFVSLVTSPKDVPSSRDPAFQVTSVNLQVKYLDVCTRSRLGCTSEV